MHKSLQFHKPSLTLRYDYLKKNAADNPPFRSVLINQAEMAEHCKVIAERDKIIAGKNAVNWMKNLSDMESTLDHVHAVFSQVDNAPREILSMKEWVSADYYMIQKYISSLKALLLKVDPELPVVRKGINGKQTRLYSLLIKIVSHTDAQIEFKNLCAFLNNYQTISVMQTTELKAIPAMIKYVLIENIQRIATRFALAAVDTWHADEWAGKLLLAAGENNGSLEQVTHQLLDADNTLKGVFAAELIGKLLKKEAIMSYPLSLINQRLYENGYVSGDYVYAIQETLAADKISLRNSISALSMLDTIDWHDFIDEVSLLERMYAAEPAGVYPFMDYYTRDRYRTESSTIARKAGIHEIDVANVALAAALKNNSHIGFSLLGEGRKELEATLGIPVSGYINNIKSRQSFKLGVYLAAIAVVTLVITGSLLFKLYQQGAGTGTMAGMGLLFLISAGYIASIIIDRLVIAVSEPALLPRMNYAADIPDHSRTLVVVPSMLTSMAEIDELVTALEVRFLGNRYKNLHFALLTDFTDADQEMIPGDEALLDTVHQKITALNKKYGEQHHHFFLLHRHRRWNPSEGCWMGYERKRGKLNDLNHLLRGRNEDSFLRITGNRDILTSVKYVITLDADTQLLPETAWKMIGTMAHPLNRPVYCEKRKRVVSGYGILQPAVKTDIRDFNSSVYHQLSSSGPDADPYLRTFPDVYQDLFGEGSFVGKGIYDVDIFLKTLGNQFPENRVLSHDLLEGSYIRSGLLNDVKLYEGSFTFWVDLRRRHRWVRGDWQIAAWLNPLVPGSDGKRVKNPLSALSKWKIFDNLRTSLLPVVLILLLLLGWTSYVMVILFCPMLLLIVSRLAEARKSSFGRKQWLDSAVEVRNRFILDSFRLACLPYEAYFIADAICRSAWRMMVSRRKLLEWVPSGSHHFAYSRLGEVYAFLWIVPLTGIVFLLLSLPVGLLWLLAPIMVWKLNLTIEDKKTELGAAQQLFLRSLTRKTWGYFEQFVNGEHHWLPPDHYQESPVGKVAEYTSPTNLGLGLLANLSALDFGYLSTCRFIQYTSETLHTIGQLERYKGHFYNWYNIRSLKPSYPRYVSTVDSGNFAGHLLVMRQGIEEIADQPVFRTVLFSGLLDTMLLIDHTVINRYKEELTLLAAGPVFPLQEGRILLERLDADIRSTTECPDVPPESESRYWLSALHKQCLHILDELHSCMPWLWIPGAPEGWPAADITLRQLTALSVTNESEKLRDCINGVVDYARQQMTALEKIASLCTDFADMQYDFLYDSAQHLLSIGYRVEERSLDVDCYDVLASEARLAVYVAVSQGKLPVSSWFAMRRPLVNIGGTFVLQSANGTMFEYLMPLLVMPDFDNTLLNLSYKSAVEKQIAYGRRHQVPWGVSESCYSTTDASLNYQYKVNGIPELSLKNGRMVEDVVISSYSAAMALMVVPEEAVRNLECMAANEFDGRYGLIESVDYMSSRMPHGKTSVPVRSFMAHHQGMSLLALHYLLQDKSMQRRFEADPALKSTIVLLQEKIPWDAACYIENADEVVSSDIPLTSADKEINTISLPDNKKTHVQLLSNGRYHLMATSFGATFSRWKDIVVTRWRDTRNTNGGVFFKVSDVETDMIWSSIYHAEETSNADYKVSFMHGQMVLSHVNDELELRTHLAIAPEDDLEVRQVTIYNHSRRSRCIEVTAYADLLLRPVSGDNAPGTRLKAEVKEAQQCIMCRREVPSAQGTCPEMFMLLKVNGGVVSEPVYETDITEEPDQKKMKGIRSGIIATIRYRITLPPGTSVTADLCLGIADSRAACEELLERTRNSYQPGQLFHAAGLHAQTLLAQTNAAEKDILLSQELLGRLIFADKLLLQGVLYGYPAFSAASPTIMLRIKRTSDMQAVEQLVDLHIYWRLHGFSVNLVILNEDRSSYRHFLHRLINEFINAGPASESLNRQFGGIIVKMPETTGKIQEPFNIAIHEIVAEEWIFQAARLKGFTSLKNEPLTPARGTLIKS